VTLPDSETIVVRGVTLRRDPAREECFRVVHSDAEMHDWTVMTEQAWRERLHRHMNNEVGGLEIAAQCLADYPEAPWELRMELARQCWDETRHVRLLYRRLVELGGRKGEFPIANFEWMVTGMLDALAARLAVQNRTFEAGQMDIVGKVIFDWRAAGDERTAEILDGILADEVQHVRFANRWIRRLVEDDRRLLLQIAAALCFLGHVTAALAPQPGEVNAVGTPIGGAGERIPVVNVEDRLRAGFTEAEVHEVLRQAGFRALVAPGPGAARP
jgi:uncharacterized ferritin-like protein (DUF455 family)